ncbi:hypothetical protein B9Z19DRAFT_987622 [Tuber borchii]|uniref:Uncharacterized protein n=1 Tax=Tuber borchii TaxID=42251 RepID=A0A2T6ZNZ0_TUBBO|nr:hypothetical protein B9Z19DRAFT_987622 [Tuber borchii]
MATQVSTAAIATFFKGYNSAHYTYDPTLAVDDEFSRLEQEQQWEPEEVQEHRKLLDRAVHLANFFWKHEWGGYAFQEGAAYDDEFWRLCQKKRWDEDRIGRAEAEFLKISGGSMESLMAARNRMPEETAPEETVPEETVPEEEAETAPAEEAEVTSEQELETSSEQEEDAETVRPEDPEAPEVQGAIARFFTLHNCLNYTYSNQAPRIEFQELAEVKERAWKARDPRGTRHKDFWKTEEFRTLKRDYHEAVEERFDGLLDMRAGDVEGYRMETWEFIVELFRLGDVPISKSKASKLIKRIYVNIYDFLEFLEAYDSSTVEGCAAEDEKYERASVLCHPSRADLAQYSLENNKVYSLKAAKVDGTLRLLLQHL